MMHKQAKMAIMHFSRIYYFWGANFSAEHHICADTKGLCLMGDGISMKSTGTQL